MAYSKASIANFRLALKSSKHIIVVAGAGLSAASGLPTFRDSNGLWKNYDVYELATPSGFRRNPGQSWQFYHMRRQAALKVTYNAAHVALAMLAMPKHLHELAARDATFTLITQNVDGLSPRALKHVQDTYGVCADNAITSVSALYEMHGRLLETLCTKCGHVELNLAHDLCPSLANLHIDGPVVEIPEADLPRCKVNECDGLLRPNVVWFEEVPHQMEEIQDVVDRADMCLVVGTSSTVFPAAGYACDVKENGGCVAVFNLDQSAADELADFVFVGPCTETLPAVLNLQLNV